MPNIAAVLRDEIRRLAKREVKAQVGKTQRVTAQYRRDIAKLKRAMRQQEKELRLLQNQTRHQDQPQPTEEELENVRFSGRWVKAQRQRLGLSAADYGKLVGVSRLAVYNWEQEKARPRKDLLAALVAVRGIGKREALQRLAEAETVSKKPRRLARKRKA